MVQPIRQADAIEDLARTIGVPRGLALRRRRDQRRREHVLEHGALREQRVILKHEPDATVPERRLLALAERIRILPVQRHGAGGWRLERAEQIKERALPAPRRTHDARGISALQPERDIRQHAQLTTRGGV